MTHEAVLQIVASEISNLIEKPVAEIEAATGESVLVLGVDSLDFMELRTLVEERLEVKNLKIEAWLELESKKADGYSLQSLVEWCVSATNPD